MVVNVLLMSGVRGHNRKLALDQGKAAITHLATGYRQCMQNILKQSVYIADIYMLCSARNRLLMFSERIMHYVWPLVFKALRNQDGKFCISPSKVMKGQLKSPISSFPL